ncbi:PTS transporter subunit EIIC [Enterococcus saccharolyticus]|uniref:PTS transporter subunit EIIC n=1 Tax=Enterococcus TaxID=1350 RepID=UPI001E30426E|nr:PTS transporter subunit EIIC [Enterococcus saccharolyticus]MCD5002302.1 PTS transporter subunit EIIC [Enterococcus saccharolyticus]
MTDKNVLIAQGIYDHVGGMANVNKVVHCMTRVRMEIRDYDKVDMEGLKKVPGVMGVVEDDTLQVVVGPGTVNKVAQHMVDMAGVDLGETLPNAGETNGKLSVEEKAAQTKAEVKRKNQKPWSKALKSISNIFVPLIPAFVGAGIIGGVASVLKNMLTAGQLHGDMWMNIATVCGIIQSGVFAYLVIYVGINSAREFGASPSLGGVIGGVTTLAGMNPEAPLTNIFTGEPLAAGQGGVIGVIIAVYFMALIEKRLRKVMPESIDIIVTPVITLLVMGLATIFLIMPFAGWISNGLVDGINWVLNVGGAFSGFVLGAAFLPMVMFGLHQILTPIHLQMIESTGSTLLLPILAMAGAGQVGAAIALWMRCSKNTSLTEMIKGALPVGILGIGEPLIYGVTLPLGRPFITACIGGGIGGAVIGLLGNVGAISIGPSGVALIPLIANGQWLNYVIGLLAGYAGGFVFTYFFGTTQAMRTGEM